MKSKGVRVDLLCSGPLNKNLKRAIDVTRDIVLRAEKSQLRSWGRVWLFHQAPSRCAGSGKGIGDSRRRWGWEVTSVRITVFTAFRHHESGDFHLVNDGAISGFEPKSETIVLMFFLFCFVCLLLFIYFYFFTLTIIYYRLGFHITPSARPNRCTPHFYGSKWPTLYLSH